MFFGVYFDGIFAAKILSRTRSFSEGIQWYVFNLIL